MRFDRAERIVFHALKRLGPGQTVPGYGIHKLLYRLAKDHPALFGDDLPFYWYEHGPFCEPVAESILTLTLSGRLAEEPVLGGFHYSIRQDEPPGELSAAEIGAIEATVKAFGNLPAKKLVADIYWEDAPYAFMPMMKHELLPRVQAISDDFSASGGNPGRRAEDALRHAPGILARCEGRLPIEPYFDEFVAAFSIYRAAVDRLLSQISSTRGPDAAAHATRVLGKSQQVWLVFAHGARVVYHHSYYDMRASEWDAQYRREVAALHREMDQFYDDVMTAVLPTLRTPSFSPVDRAILSAAFRDDPPTS